MASVSTPVQVATHTRHPSPLPPSEPVPHSPQEPIAPPPDVLLILGTDAAGKNHITNVLVEQLAAQGISVEKRGGWASSPPSDVLTSEDKGALKKGLEHLFLAVYPFIRFAVLPVVTLMLYWDIWRYRTSTLPIIIISHSPMRLLAFWMGHTFKNPQDMTLPTYLLKAFTRFKQATGAQVVVLDVADSVRQARIANRKRWGKADPFDLYMAHDSQRSERIEAFLVWLAQHQLDAVLIENNDLSNSQLTQQFSRAFTQWQQPS